MAMLCKRCYINAHPEMKKNDIKKLVVTTDSFHCDNCGKLTKLVVEPRKKEVWEDEEED